ncbi:helix-turn-helix domain-containing protein [Nocardia sp. NPDC050413]|uniref:helix-turn-helix domain-containing protein n=1 Tax=Nocardia sp. NPDC050413 TaxID=3155784 RepID=UPI00340AB3C6
MTLTSQQAADLLGVSHPTVKRLIEKGQLPAERIGTRHRLALDDVLDYRETHRRQYDALAETAVDISIADDPADIDQHLREARRVAAERAARRKDKA